jgi:di/tricarboxylate transporter
MDRKIKSYLIISILAVSAGFISSLIVKYLFAGRMEISTLKAIMSGSFVANIMLLVICSAFRRRLKKNGLDGVP